MAATLTLDDVRRAWDTRDPELPRLIAQLAEQPDPVPEKPIREGAPTFDQFLYEIRTPQFRKKPKDEQAHVRVERMKVLEAPDAEVPLPDRLKLHAVILDLWTADDPFARSCLLEVIATCPLTYGPWRVLKRIFKESEATRDTEVYGASRPDSTRSMRHAVIGRSVRRRSRTWSAGRGGSYAGWASNSRRPMPIPPSITFAATRTTPTGGTPGSPTTSSSTRRSSTAGRTSATGGASTRRPGT